MQLTFDAADRLVDLIHARRGPVAPEVAARELFALASTPGALARALLDDVVRDDARLAWRGELVGLTQPPGVATPLETARFVVFDLETTGLSPVSSRICEIGAQRVDAYELTDTFATLVNPGVPIPRAVAALTGIGSHTVIGAPRPADAVRRFLAFAGDACLVAHNARFDMAFLDREVERLTGLRVAAPVVDTVWLARRLLGDRTRRVGLASLAHFFGTAAEPCHRALPDAQATAEILLRLIGMAQERGARSVADLVELAAPRARKLNVKRSLVAGAPTTPGVYTFRDASGQALYIGRARNLRARLRSYFAGGRQRHSVEAALSALAAIDWVETGSELAAAVEEHRLLRELRPPANARGTHPDRHVYLRRRDGRWSVTADPTPLGPLTGRRLAERAARALDGFDGDTPVDALPGLRARMRRLAEGLRFEDAARLRDRVNALESVVERLERLERARRLRVCVLVPDRDPRFERAFFVSGGRIAAVRAVPRGPAGAVELALGRTDADRPGASPSPAEIEEVLLVESMLRRPAPELRVVPLDEPLDIAA